MTHDPYDRDNIASTGSATPGDPYLRRSYGSPYGGSGIALVVFAVVAILLIGFAMFGGSATRDTVSTPQTSTGQTSQVQPQPAAPAGNEATTSQ